MLSSLLGDGIARFVVREEGQRPAWDSHPLLVIATDQGSDGWSASWYLIWSLQIFGVVIGDTSHRVWNDSCNALRDAGLWAATRLLLVCLNFDHGPWADARWLESCREASHTYVRTTAWQEDPLFVGLLARMAADREEMHETSSAEYCEELFRSFPQVFARKTQKVGGSRWFGLVDGLTQLLPDWHRRLCILAYLAVLEGLMTNTAQVAGVEDRITQPRRLRPPGMPTTFAESGRHAATRCC